MDAFFASVEQLTRPTLRDRPVLVGGTGGRGVVAGASYEARVFGARSAMPMHQARRLVGINVVVLPPRGAVYGVASRRVFATVRSMIPVLEQLSFDEAFGEPVELAGATIETVAEYIGELRSRVLTETGLTASVGAGSGKQLAKIASGLAKPDGVRIIAPEEQGSLLADLPVRKLWGIGPVAEERLNRLGINTIGQLATLQTSEVASVLGGTVGPALHRLARGIDERPVAERAETKQISAESTFADDLTTLDQLREAIEPIGAHAHRRLITHGRGVRTVTVKLRRSDMSILTRSATLPYATTERAVLMSAARRLLLDPVEIGPIRLVGVGFSGFSDVQQTSLFPDLDQTESVAETDEAPSSSAPAPSTASWGIGDDVIHSEYGHGWIQGTGHGVMTVRFETRSSGPGIARTFGVDDPGVTRADPVASLDWPGESAESIDDGDEI
ncbi:DNA polymerase IV [Mycobacteroides salmoniphilum]|uniref:DNA polymerase IV n=2 Tax=Mycobacteroides salmoniphilum TaxID=404941 RepID=A0A4R8SP70_9MYCO|nr:DNA polymerase IV [Mycobacteroides salmoniphilum]TEA00758.1 DNA polymerase IV [Mycobacteroides salmoniphilum]